MKIVVFGSNGMLGRYVSTYFKSIGREVIEINRDKIDVSIATEEFLTMLLLRMGVTSGDVVINCIGLIKQRDNVNKVDFLQINTLFPLLLANVCEVNDINMIHPTTDCVYDGLGGKYDEDSVHDDIDIYGVSKSLGEPENATVIRSSIIGEEIRNKLSFVEWVKSNEGKTVFGFTNHYWNGITCLEFAKICEIIINNNNFWKGVKHYMTEEINTKSQMVSYVNDVYELGMSIVEKDTYNKCDRSLSTYYIPEYSKPLKEQIVEMKNFHNILVDENL